MFAGAFEFIAGLPEKDRQKAIDRMKATHLEAIAALKQFEIDSAADLAAGRAALNDEG
jgi:hypothetical protein